MGRFFVNRPIVAIVISILTDKATEDAKYDNALLAEATKVVVGAL